MVDSPENEFLNSTHPLVDQEGKNNNISEHNSPS